MQLGQMPPTAIFSIVARRLQTQKSIEILLCKVLDFQIIVQVADIPRKNIFSFDQATFHDDMEICKHIKMRRNGREMTRKVEMNTLALNLKPT